MNKFLQFVAEFFSTPWAIVPERLALMTVAVNRMLAAACRAGDCMTDEDMQRLAGELVAATEGIAGDERDLSAERLAARAQATEGNVVGSVAVLPIRGVITHRASLFAEFFGFAASTEGIARRLRAALADPQVSTILLDIDSPGGSVYGVPELSAEILAAREQKKLVAVANPLAASAAYWIGVSAHELVVTPSGEVGSIGVWTAHQDVSKMAEMLGVKITLISAGKYKVEGNPFEPLGEDARAAIQKAVDEYYGMFVQGVAKARNVKTAEVRGGFAEGRVVRAKEAVELGMADRVATFDETLARLSAGGRVRDPAKRSASLAARRLDLAERL